MSLSRLLGISQAIGPCPNPVFRVELQYAKGLSPLATDTYVFFFGYERSEPAYCLQRWGRSLFKAKVDKAHTAEH